MYDPNLHITAGALREAGAEIPADVPDHAYIPRTALVIKDIECGPGQKPNSVACKVLFDLMSPFVCDEEPNKEASFISIPVGDNSLIFPAVPRSNAGTLEFRKEEDEHFNSIDTLEQMRKWYLAVSKSNDYNFLFEKYDIKTWQDFLMLSCKFVAEFYEMDRNELLNRWVRRIGISLCFQSEV